MSDFGFTPGPWQQNQEYPGIIESADGLNVATVSYPRYYENEAWPDADQVAANAHLIKESPELLRAALAFHEVVCEEHPHLAATRQVHALRAAITEATGEKWKVTT